MNENTGSSKKRKAISAALAVAMVATMLLSGTLAYFYSSKAVNTFSAGPKQVIAHDDFEEGVNKDIYVENIGETDVYVRVKLTEDLSLKKSGTETTHGTPTTPLNHDFVEITPAPTEPTETHDPIHDYFTWEMGGEKTNVLSATDPQFAATNVDTGNGVYLDDENVAHDNYRIGVAKQDAQTLETPACKVISMEEYLGYDYNEDVAGHTANEPTMAGFVGWVYDEEGWYYWSQKLKAPAEGVCSVTGLLLDNVTVVGLDAYQYTYNINVTYQAVDDEDMALWTEDAQYDADGNYVGYQDQPSANAQTLLAVAKNVADGVESAPKLVDLQNKMKAAEAKNALGAARLYEYAMQTYSGEYPFKERLGVASPYTAEQYEAFADEASNAFDTNQSDEAAVLIDLSSTPSIDAGVAKALVAQYGSEDKLTKNQARSVVNLDFDQTAYNFTDLEDLTADNFPHLAWLKFSANGMITQDKLDAVPVKGQITKLRILNQKNLESIDVSGYPELVYLDLDGCSKLTAFSGLPENKLLGLSVRKTGYAQPLDMTNQPQIEYLHIGDKVPSVINDENLTELQQFFTGDNTAITELDFSNSKKLAYINISTGINIERLVLSKDSFSKLRSGLIAGGSVNVACGLIFHSTKLGALDLSGFSNYAGNNVYVAITGTTSDRIPATVIRKASQPEFCGYPTSKDGYKNPQDVIEKIIDGNGAGKDKYLLHKANGDVVETDETAFNRAGGGATGIVFK